MRLFLTLRQSVDGKLQEEAAKRRNAIAIANLTMAFTNESVIGIAYKAMMECGMAKWICGFIEEVLTARHDHEG
jgi:hypothetical protein